MKYKKLLTMLTVLLVVLSYQNCSKIPLQPFTVSSYNLSNIQADFCTTPADSIPTKMKFIFVIDRSSSNCRRVLEGSALGTDPHGVRRFPQITSFLQNYSPKDPTNTFYAYMDFATNPAPFFQNKTTFFINDKNVVANHVQQQYQPYLAPQFGCPDQGDADFDSTLNSIKKQITNDLDQEVSNHTKLNTPIIASNYVIFFISDGSPHVTDPKTGNYVIQPQATILGDVNSIVQLLNNPNYSGYVDTITMNTGLYTQDDPNSTYYNQPANPLNLQNEADVAKSTYLSPMATAGYGTFYQFDNGNVIDFSRFAVPQKADRYTMKEVWVYNANTVWDRDAYGIPYLAPDSDGDGLSDRMEKLLGSDPNKYDSDGNGLGDGVEYMVFGQPCYTPGCIGQTASTANCAGFNLNQSNPALPVLMQDTDLDDLNDCEELLLGSKRDDPDTNKDGIPDGLAFHAGIQITGASNPTSTDSDGDGVTDYQEIKYNSPVNVSNSTVPNLVPVKYLLSQTGVTDTQDCYHLEVQNMVFQGNNDHIRIYILEQPRSDSQHLVFRRAEKNQNFGFIRFQESDFSIYKK